VSPSEIAFLAIGLIVGAAVGAAIAEGLRARPAPRGEVPARRRRSRRGRCAGCKPDQRDVGEDIRFERHASRPLALHVYREHLGSVRTGGPALSRQRSTWFAPSTCCEMMSIRSTGAPASSGNEPADVRGVA